MKRSISLAAYSLILGVFTVAAFHVPFFSHVISHLDSAGPGVAVVAFLALMLVALDFLFYYLLVFFARTAGRIVIAITLIANAISAYLFGTYQQLASVEMMGNILHSSATEVSGYLSAFLILFVLFLGVMPAVYAIKRKPERGSWRKLLLCTLLAVLVGFGSVLANVGQIPNARRHSTELGGLLLPWSYTVNSVRFLVAEHERHADAILLPDATITTDTEDVCVLIIGESARRDHFSLYGYERETNPCTSRDSVTALPAKASNTYTIACVKAMLEPWETEELYETLPDYLYRAGVDVEWRTSNWGEPPLHIDKRYDVKALAKMYPGEDARHDGILLAGLKEDILASPKPKQFIVLHTYANHGPMYFRSYPPEFEVFTPAGKTIDEYKADPRRLYNVYDNCMLYSDWIIHSVIEILKGMPSRRACLIYMSDHGESLGENKTYMHSTPLEIAPKEQLEIPFLVWTQNAGLTVKDLPEVGQHHIYHSVLRFFGVDSPVFDESLCVFE
ncbi:MAG: sulfatase-like hydrolase/transferase [Bacteroidales bacterium]|nr:sulfatase-like hydrolase/transferase [Bacteroidales bacterium]